MSNHIKNHNKLYTVISFFIASALILTPLIVSNDALAQPSNFNKLSKVEKCASGDLPPSACKKVSERSQANSGDIDAGQTGGEYWNKYGWKWQWRRYWKFYRWFKQR